MKYLHDQDIIHGNIRLENILVQNKHTLKDGMGTTYFDIKLIDFRLSHFSNYRKVYVKENVYYQAPELTNQ